MNDARNSREQPILPEALGRSIPSSSVEPSTGVVLLSIAPPPSPPLKTISLLATTPINTTTKSTTSDGSSSVEEEEDLDSHTSPTTTSPIASSSSFCILEEQKEQNQEQKQSRKEIEADADGFTSLPWTSLPALSSATGDYLVARHKSTLRVTLNRPSRGNALSRATVEGLTALFREYVNEESTIHRVVITGKGKYFCTGMDLGSSSSSSPPPKEQDQQQDQDEEQDDDDDDDDDDPLFSPTQIPLHARLLTNLFRTIDTCPKQTIALLNGPAFGGGVGLLTVCDIRLASSARQLRRAPIISSTTTTTTTTTSSNNSSSSPFFCCLSEVRLGLCPATIARYLVREWGPSLARMAMVSGRRIGADELLRAGVLHGLLELPPPLPTSSSPPSSPAPPSFSSSSSPPVVVTPGEEQVRDQDLLERAFVKEWLLPSLRYAAPGAVGLCKGLVGATVEGADMDERGVRVFEEMMSPSGAPGTGTGTGKRMHEARVGVGLFRKGVKGVVWEDLDVEEHGE